MIVENGRESDSHERDPPRFYEPTRGGMNMRGRGSQSQRTLYDPNNPQKNQHREDAHDMGGFAGRGTHFQHEQRMGPGPIRAGPPPPGQSRPPPPPGGYARNAIPHHLPSSTPPPQQHDSFELRTFNSQNSVFLSNYSVSLLVCSSCVAGSMASRGNEFYSEESHSPRFVFVQPSTSFIVFLFTQYVLNLNVCGVYTGRLSLRRRWS